MSDSNDKNLPPVTSIDEEGIPDIPEIDSADGLVFHDDDADSGKDTPTVIRDLDANAPEPIDQSNVPTMMIDTGGRRRVLIGLLAVLGLVLIVSVGVLVSSSSSDRETLDTSDLTASVTDSDDSAGDTETPSIIEDVTDDPETVTEPSEKTVVVPTGSGADTSTDVEKTLAVFDGYDAEACAAPKTQKAWAECVSVAYAGMRQNQKVLESENARLTARVDELEGTPGATSTPTWVILALIGLSILVLGMGITMYRKREGDGETVS